MKTFPRTLALLFAFAGAELALAQPATPPPAPATPAAPASPAIVPPPPIPAPAVIEPKVDLITVNVLGAVAKQGAYQLPKGSTLLDAIAAAGGATPQGSTKKVSILRGAAGKKPEKTVYDIGAIFRGEATNPQVRGSDTINIPERMF